MRRFGNGLRVDALVAGSRYVQRVRSTVVSPRTPRTLMSSRLASDVADAPHSKRCTRLPWLGQVCGVTTRVAIALPGCKAIRLPVVVSPMPRGAELIIGADVLGRVRCRRRGGR